MADVALFSCVRVNIFNENEVFTEKIKISTDFLANIRK